MVYPTALSEREKTVTVSDRNVNQNVSNRFGLDLEVDELRCHQSSKEINNDMDQVGEIVITAMAGLEV